MLFRQAKVKSTIITLKSTIKPALQQMLKGFVLSRNTREEKRSIQLTPNN